MNHSHKNQQHSSPGNKRKPARQAGTRSIHIMNVSSSLIGICLVIIASIRVFGQAEKTVVDQITAIAALCFMTSCMLSFLSIRNNSKRHEKMENIADLIFLGGLSLLFITTILLSFNMIR